MHSWVKGFQVCSNEGPCPFPRRDDYEIVKIHWWNLHIFYSRTTGSFSTKLSTKHLWLKGIQVCPKTLTKFLKSSSTEPQCQFQPNFAQSIFGWRGLILFKWRTIQFSKSRKCVFPLLFNVMIKSYERFSQMSDEVHGSLVPWYIKYSPYKISKLYVWLFQ